MGGLNSDVHPSFQPENTARYILNMVPLDRDGNTYSVTNEDGTSEYNVVFPEGFMPIGYTILNTDIIVVLADSEGNSQVGFISETLSPNPTSGFYQPVAPANSDGSVPEDNKELGFSQSYPVDCVARKLINGHRILYYTDNNQEFGFIDLEEPPQVGQASEQSRLIPNMSLPRFTYSINEDGAGNFPPGAYQIVTRYVTKAGGVTAFGIPSDVVPMVPTTRTSGVDKYKGDNWDGESISKSISFELTNVDTNFEEIEIFLIYFQGENSELKANRLAVLPTAETVRYTVLGLQTEDSFQVTRAELEAIPVAYNRAKCIEQKDNRLFLSNLATAETSDLQEIANDIKVRYNVLEVPFSNRGYNNNSNSSNIGVMFLNNFPFIDDSPTRVTLDFNEDVSGTPAASSFSLEKNGNPPVGTITVDAVLSVGDTIIIGAYDTQSEVTLTAVASDPTTNEFVVGATNEETAENISNAISASSDVTLMTSFDSDDSVDIVLNIVDSSANIPLTSAELTTSPISGGNSNVSYINPVDVSVDSNRITLTFPAIVTTSDNLAVTEDIQGSSSNTTWNTNFDNGLPSYISVTSNQSGNISGKDQGFTDYVDEQFTSRYKGYRRGEVYSLGFQLLYNNGTLSDVYHIPGNVENVDGSISSGSQKFEGSDWVDFGQLEGDLGTYVSELDYPKNSLFPGDLPGDDSSSSIQQSGYERKIRHHYIPTNTKEPHYKNDDGQEFVRIIGLEFDFNTPIPQDSLKDVAEIIFVREQRNSSSKRSVFSQGITSRMAVSADSYDSDGYVEGSTSQKLLNGSTVQIRSGYKASPVMLNDSLDAVEEFIFPPQSSSSNGNSNSLEDITRGFSYPGYQRREADGSYSDGKKFNTEMIEGHSAFHCPEGIFSNGDLNFPDAKLNPVLQMVGDEDFVNQPSNGSYKYNDVWVSERKKDDKRNHLRARYFCNYNNYVEAPITQDAVTIKQSRKIEQGVGGQGVIDTDRLAVNNRWGSEYVEIISDENIPRLPTASNVASKQFKIDFAQATTATNQNKYEVSRVSSFFDSSLRYLFNIESNNPTQYESIGGEYIIADRRFINPAGVYPAIFGGDTFITKMAYSYGNIIYDVPFHRQDNSRRYSGEGYYKDTESWDAPEDRGYYHFDQGTQNRYPAGFLQGWDLRDMTYFFVESEINTYYRNEAKDEDGKIEEKLPFFPNTPYKTCLRTSFPIQGGSNTGGYNAQYSADNSVRKFGTGFGTETISSFENRTIYSNIASSDDTLDNYRVFSQNDFYDLPANTGPIWDSFVAYDRLYLHTTKSLWRTFAEPAATLSGGNIDDVVLGTGNLFARPSQEMVTAEGGYAGTVSQFGGSQTQVGYIFPDILQGKVFGLVTASNKAGSTSVQLRELSKDSISTFLHKNMGVGILEDLSLVTTNTANLIDNPYMGLGFIGGYDYKLKRAWIIKQSAESNFSLSFSAVTNVFSSFHSYSPNMIIPFDNRVFFMKDGLAWEMNKGSKNNFFGEQYTSDIEIVGGSGKVNGKVFDNIVIDSEAYDDNGAFVKETFDTIQATTPNQDTGVVTIIDGDDYDAIANDAETLVRYKNDEYRIVIPRNLDDDESRIKGDYSIIKLVYNGINKFIVKLIQIKGRTNAR